MAHSSDSEDFDCSVRLAIAGVHKGMKVPFLAGMLWERENGKAKEGLKDQILATFGKDPALTRVRVVCSWFCFIASN